MDGVPDRPINSTDYSHNTFSSYFPVFQYLLFHQGGICEWKSPCLSYPKLLYDQSGICVSSWLPPHRMGFPPHTRLLSRRELLSLIFPLMMCHISILSIMALFLIHLKIKYRNTHQKKTNSVLRIQEPNYNTNLRRWLRELFDTSSYNELLKSRILNVISSITLYVYCFIWQ